MITRAVAALALVAGCGPDVTPPALAIDAAPAVDASTPMRVRVLSIGGERPQGAPALGARVGFLPPTGAPVVITTGDDGLATADMPSGTVIVVAQSRGFGVADTTIVFDVDAGADLTLGDRATPQLVGDNLGMRRATVAPWDGVVELAASCSSGSGGQLGTELTWFQFGCASAADATVVARAFGDDGLQAYAVLTHVDLRVDAPLTLPAWRPVTAARLVLTNLPLSLESAFAQRVAHDGLDDWSQVSSGAPVEGASVVLPLRSIPIGERTITSVDLREDGLVAYRAQLRRPVTELTTVVDVGGDAPPRVTSSLFTVDERRLTWSYQGSGRRPDLIRALILSDVDGFGRVHEIIAPGGRTSLVLPPLPPEFADVDFDGVTPAFLQSLGAVELPDVLGFADAASLVDLWTPTRGSLDASLGRAPFDWWITGA